MPAVAAPNKWGMPEDGADQTGLIGPNAILQLLPVVEEYGGRRRVTELMANAGLAEAPDGKSMIPERDAARLHRQLRCEEPGAAIRLSKIAGQRTAAYILKHRIPRPAHVVLKALPASLAAYILARAIAQHAWTFAGSGRFRALTPWHFQIENNPLIRGETHRDVTCHWHAAVFEHLYRALVHRRCRAVETKCGCQGHAGCEFEIRLVRS